MMEKYWKINIENEDIVSVDGSVYGGKGHCRAPKNVVSAWIITQIVTRTPSNFSIKYGYRLFSSSLQ